MEDLLSQLDSLLHYLRSLPPGPLGKGWIIGIVFLIAIFFLAYTLERFSGASTAQYRTRDFGHDVLYTLYYNSGLQHFLFVASILVALEAPLSFLDLRPLVHLPFAAQVLIVLLFNDLLAYWVHRAQHRFKFFWAFHSMHHSQEHVSYATGNRQHPLETWLFTLITYVPMRIIGFDPVAWLPLSLLISVQLSIMHSQIPWRFGPLYKIVVTPKFHCYHHSTNPQHFNRNFGQTFSFWDRLFGTALPDNEPPPTRYGLEGVRPTTFVGTLILPFQLLRKFYLPPQSGNAAVSGGTQLTTGEMGEWSLSRRKISDRSGVKPKPPSPAVP